MTIVLISITAQYDLQDSSATVVNSPLAASIDAGMFSL